MKAATALIFALCIASAVADVYMHNPRGSNDRNCEKNVNRNNGNRMFDSQNNAKGGYACPRAEGGAQENPKQYYYVGSKLAVEWTNQHGCGPNEKVGCEIVLQHACEDTLDPTGQYRAGANVGTPRDGTPTNGNDDATDTIPNNANNAVANNAANRRFGMHESQEYYAACQTRQRNNGLFTADQNVNRNDARGTRQNPNGNRNGLECPEERDYYPYWHPTPWSDIAVLTSDTSRCAMYKAESQNVKPKGVCVNGASKQQAQNNKAACEAAGNTWAEVRYHVKYNAATSGTKDITTPPVCANNQVSRVNQLGNAAGPIPGDDPAAVDAMSEGLYANRYVWTIPDKVQENCVLRLRYNISTADFAAWGANAVNASFNGDKSPVQQDPYVKTGPAANDILSLALNTNQYARTFQDRSYVYAVKARPAGVGTGVIFNLNTVGKRGNIVQTYPGTEYNFQPNILNVPVGSNVHVLVTGSDYNPRRGCNNGEGGPPSPPNNGAANNNARADRTNFVEVGNLAHNIPADIATAGAAGAFTAFVDAAGQPDMATINRLAFLDQKKALAAQNQECLTETQLNNINNNNRRENNLRNCAKLNAVKYPVSDLGVVTLRKAGVFGYMSSRNNNFSNRDQTSAFCVGATEECATLSNADAAPGGAPGAGAPSAPIYQLPSDKPPPAKTLDPALDVKAPEDRDNDAVGDGEMKGCENQIWDLIQGMGPFGAAILGVGMFAMGVAAALFVGWWARRNSGAGRTDQAWMSTPHSSL